MTSRPLPLLLGALGVGLGLFAAFVWPTLYEQDSPYLRRNRFTGSLTMRLPGWQEWRRVRAMGVRLEPDSTQYAARKAPRP